MSRQLRRNAQAYAGAFAWSRAYLHLPAQIAQPLLYAEQTEPGATRISRCRIESTTRIGYSHFNRLCLSLYLYGCLMGASVLGDVNYSSRGRL